MTRDRPNTEKLSRSRLKCPAQRASRSSSPSQVVLTTYLLTYLLTYIPSQAFGPQLSPVHENAACTSLPACVFKKVTYLLTNLVPLHAGNRGGCHKTAASMDPSGARRPTLMDALHAPALRTHSLGRRSDAGRWPTSRPGDRGCVEPSTAITVLTANDLCTGGGSFGAVYPRRLRDSTAVGGVLHVARPARRARSSCLR